MKPGSRTERGVQIAKAYPGFICASVRDLQAQELRVSDSGSSCPSLSIPPFLAESERARLYKHAAADPLTCQVTYTWVRFSAEGRPARCWGGSQTSERLRHTRRGRERESDSVQRQRVSSLIGSRRSQEIKAERGAANVCFCHCWFVCLFDQRPPLSPRLASLLICSNGAAFMIAQRRD